MDVKVPYALPCHLSEVGGGQLYQPCDEDAVFLRLDPANYAKNNLVGRVAFQLDGPPRAQAGAFEDIDCRVWPGAHFITLDQGTLLRPGRATAGSLLVLRARSLLAIRTEAAVGYVDTSSGEVVPTSTILNEPLIAYRHWAIIRDPSEASAEVLYEHKSSDLTSA